MSNTVAINLLSGWRQLSDDERAGLGALVQDDTIRLIAVADNAEGSSVPNLVITGGELFSAESDEAMLADSGRRLAEAFPGFHLIDDIEWPLTPARARFRTGVYILENLSMTVSQLAWITHQEPVGSQGHRRLLWTATCTCPSMLFPTTVDSFMEMIPTLEVTP